MCQPKGCLPERSYMQESRYSSQLVHKVRCLRACLPSNPNESEGMQSEGLAADNSEVSQRSPSDLCSTKVTYMRIEHQANLRMDLRMLAVGYITITKMSW